MIAKALNKPIEDILDMDSHEYEMWENYFHKTPPLDISVPVILAQIWTIVAQFAGVKNAEPSMVAPWLAKEKKELTPAEKKKKRLEKANQFRQFNASR